MENQKILLFSHRGDGKKEVIVMRKFRKIISLILTFALVLGMIGASGAEMVSEPRLDIVDQLIENEISMARERSKAREIPDLESAQGQRLIEVFDNAIADLEQSLNENEEEYSESEERTSNVKSEINNDALISTDISVRHSEAVGVFEDVEIPVEIDLSIYRIEELRDFAGNLYTLVELNPYGYMIYHNDSGIFPERSPTGTSPFAGLYGDNLLYGGFTNYFYSDDNENLVHTLTEDIVESYVVEENKDSLVKYSEGISDGFYAYVNRAMVDYVDYGTVTVRQTTSSTNRSSGGSTATWYPASPWRYVTNSDFISRQTVNQSSTGSTGNKPEQGHCGFVALGIVLGYHDHLNTNMGIINASLSPQRVTNRGTSSSLVTGYFVEDLRSIGDNLGIGRQGTSATERRNIAKKYLENRGVWNRFSDTLHINALTTTNARIADSIYSSKPVILGAEGLPGTGGGGHAVVAFGYRTEGSYSSIIFSYTFRVNYGWGTSNVNSGGTNYNANDVWVTGHSWNNMLSFKVS